MRADFHGWNTPPPFPILSYWFLRSLLKSQVAQLYRIYLPMQEVQEMWVLSLGPEDLLEGEMATHSSILAWEIPWTEEPG